MKKENIIFIIGIILILGIASFYLFSNSEVPKEKEQSILVAEEKKQKNTTSSNQNQEKEEGVTVEVLIKKEGFNQKEVTLKKEGNLGIMNHTGQKVTLMGDKFFKKGKDLLPKEGIGLPYLAFSSQNIKELTFWLQKNPKEKLKVNIK